MARNGTGTYSLVSGNPVITGTTISSTWANNTLTDIATALTGSIAADGQTPITGNIPLSGFKLTGLAAGSTAGDSVRYEQVIGVYAAIAGSASQNFAAKILTASGVLSTSDTTEATSTTAASMKTAGGLGVAKAIIGGSTIKSTTGMAVGGATPGTGGIAFPAVAVAVADVNTLDDYEEGTWTPVIGGSGGTSGQSYSGTTSGKYTKIGNHVFCTALVSLTNKGTITTNLQLQGLPLASGSYSAAAISYLYKWSCTAAHWLACYLPNGATAADFYQISIDGAVPDILATAAVVNDSQITLSIHYSI